MDGQINSNGPHISKWLGLRPASTADETYAHINNNQIKLRKLLQRAYHGRFLNKDEWKAKWNTKTDNETHEMVDQTNSQQQLQHSNTGINKNKQNGSTKKSIKHKIHNNNPPTNQKNTSIALEIGAQTYFEC